jgi:hypothetical protein
MATKAGVGMSRHHNPNVAGREAAEQALEKAGVDRPDFVFMFASIGYDQPSLLRAVREATGGAPLSGCSAEGTMNGDDVDESNFSVLVTAISSEELQWTNGLARGLENDSRAVGQRIAQNLQTDLSAETIGLFVFPDGLTLTLDTFFGGLEENLPSERVLPLWGGGAGNNFNAEGPTYQYCDDEVISDGVSYALLSGEAQTAWAISHGLVPIGGERKVTRSKGNVIYEIDGKPATEVLKEYTLGLSFQRLLVRSRACPRRSTKTRRLYKPVRRSWEARRSSSASRALRSDMSVETPIMPAGFPRSSKKGVAVPNTDT